MKYVSVILPVMEDRTAQESVRRSVLDLLDKINSVDTDAVTALGMLSGSVAVQLPTVAPPAGSGLLWSNSGVVTVA